MIKSDAEDFVWHAGDVVKKPKPQKHLTVEDLKALAEGAGEDER